MKIALLPGVFFPQPGGAQVQTHNLANKLIKMGHKVDLLILNKTNIKNNLYNIIVINKLILSLLYYINLYFKLDLSFLIKPYLRLFLKKKKYDIFHFQLLNMKMIYILKLLKSLDQKVIVTFQGIDIQIDKKINYGYRLDSTYAKSLMNIIHSIDMFFSLSENIYHDLLDLGIDRKKIVMMPNAVEINKFSRNQIKKSGIDNKINLITIARFAKNKKGFDLLPQIASRLVNNKINFQWSIVGYNSVRIKDLPEMNNFKKNFLFFENIENLNEEFYPHSSLIEILKKNHLYINLARIESFGITIIEALASKLPVITFNTKGGNELIKNGFNGTIVEEYLPDKMTDAIINYFENKNLYENQKKNTYDSIAKFDLSIIAKESVKIYQNINSIEALK